MITSSCVKLMEWCFKSLGGVVNHATLQKTHTQTILLATGRNYPYTKHNWAFHILLRSITFPLARDFLDCLPGSPRSFSSNFSHLCLSAADITTSFQRHKWPQTKTYTNSDTVFWHSISCPRCYLFCYWWWHLKPSSYFLFFLTFWNLLAHLCGRLKLKQIWHSELNGSQYLHEKPCQKFVRNFSHFFFQVTFVFGKKR